MAKLDARKQPDYSEKQRLFYGEKATEHEISAAAAQAEESGILSDALDLFARVKDSEALRRLQVRARNEGDLFLFDKAARLLGSEPTQDDYSQLAQRAEEQGKLAYARKAFIKAGNEERANQIDEPSTQLDEDE